MDETATVPQPSDVERQMTVYRGDRLDRLSPFRKQPDRPNVSPGYIIATLVGSADLLYDQIATRAGKVTFLDSQRCISLYNDLVRKGFATFGQENPVVWGDISVKAGEVTVESLANTAVRIHQSSGQPHFIYGMHDEGLLHVLGHMSRDYLAIPPGISVHDHHALVYTGSAQFYDVTLPAYGFSEVYVDSLRFDTDQVVAGIRLGLIDQGVREMMKKHGLKSMTMMAFFCPDLKPYKQVMVYHDELPSTAPVQLPLACDHPREEFFIRSRALPDGQKAVAGIVRQ